MNVQPLSAETPDLSVKFSTPLVILDVDEALAMFVRGFERVVGHHCLEMRTTRFA